MKNFATYRNQEWSFTKALSPVFVSGDTGAGKTTFFIDAVTAALYGRAYGEMRPGVAREVISQDASQAMVSLSFEIGGEQYRVVRFFYRRETSKAQLRKISGGEDVVIASQPNEVDTKVFDIIKMDYKAFLNTVVIRQGEVASIISKNLDPAERRQIFLDAFNIEFQKHQEQAKTERLKLQNDLTKLDTYIEQLQEQAKTRPNIEATKRTVESEIKNLTQKLVDAEADLKQLLNRKKQLESDATLIIKTTAEKKGRLEELELHKQDLHNSEAESSTLREKIAKADIHKFERVEEMIAKIVRLTEKATRIRELEREEEELTGVMKDAEALEAKASMLASVPEDIKSTEEQFKQISIQIRDADLALSEKSTLLSTLENREDMLHNSNETCPICGSKITSDRKEEIQRHLEEERAELENLHLQEKTHLSSLQNVANRLEAEVEKLREQSCELSNIEGQLRRLKECRLRKRSIESKITKSKTGFDEAKKEVEAFTGLPYRESLPYLHQLSEVSREYARMKNRLEFLDEFAGKLRTEVEALERDVSGIDASLKALEKIEAERQSIEDEEESSRRRIEELKRDVNSSEAILQTYDEQLVELSKVEGLIGEKMKEREECELDLQAYEVLETKIFHSRGVPSILLKDYVERIELYARRYLNRFLPDKDIRIEVTEKQISIKVLDSGVERGLETYSGGESVIIGFAIRLAIGRTLTEALTWERPHFLMIDEGFGPLDESLRMSVIEALRSLEDEYEQIYVISHMMDIKTHPLFQTLVDVDKSDGVSRLKVVQGIILP